MRMLAHCTSPSRAHLAVVLTAAALAVAAAAAGALAAVDGVLAFDEYADHPLYLTSSDLAPGQAVAAVKVHVNDEQAPPAGVWLVPADDNGLPVWGDRIPLLPGVDLEEPGLLAYQGSEAAVGTRVWIGVEFASGNGELGSGLGEGPGIGYWQAVEPQPGRCLLSSDAGASFDGLDPMLALAIVVEKGSIAGGWLTKRPPALVEEGTAVTALIGARPNPFNPRTEIGFTLAATGPAHVTVYDLRGRRVRTLVDTAKGAGEHWVTWDGLDDGGSPVASGSYHVVLRAGGTRLQQKLLLVR